MSFFADILSSLFERKLALTRRVEDDNKPIEELCEALLSSRGEVSGMTLAQLILDRYASFDEASKLSWFFRLQMIWMCQLKLLLLLLKSIMLNLQTRLMKL